MGRWGWRLLALKGVKVAWIEKNSTLEWFKAVGCRDQLPEIND